MRASSLPAAAAAASTNPAEMLGLGTEVGLPPGMRADLVELDESLRVVRVMRGGEWFEPA